MSLLKQSYDIDVNFLKAKATRQSIIGVIIGLAAMGTATLLAAFYQTGKITLAGLLAVQQDNFVLWFLDIMPFGFAVWGQYVGTIMAYEAGSMVRDQTQELRTRTAALEIQARHDMTHDSLTGLPNRVLLFDRLDQAVTSAMRDKRKLGLLMLDVNRFKEINETLGHYTGDRLLKQMVVRLKGVVRESDTLARLGGDEFGILLRNVTREKDLEKVADTIRRALDHPFLLDGLTLDVQVGMGGAIFPEHGEDVDSLMQHADVAMYAAKQENKGYVLYSEKLETTSPQRLTLMGELRQAIKNDELVLFYQPKVDNKSERVIGVEALVRWQHPRHGLMRPDEFIPLAERTGLIKQLSMWVLNKALEQSFMWRESDIDLSVSVNLSAQDLLDPDLPDVVAGLLAKYNVPAHQVVLEITETSIMADPEQAMQVLSRLSLMGVKMSIDDFGTGYSSLAYLRKLPVSEIKIDRSFVKDMLENPSDEVIVQATIGLARNLGLDVVAEGVESNATHEKLKVLACNLLQGYLFSRPLNGPDFIAWYKDRASTSDVEPGKSK